jgi:hypothetical protein
MPQLHLTTLVYTFVALLFAALVVEGVKDPWSVFKPTGFVITIMGFGLVVFDKWLWSLRILHGWFVSRPYIKGTWKGQLISKFVDPKTGLTAPPIEVYLVIRQKYFTIHMRLLTKESMSETLAMEIPKAADGVYTIGSVYLNTPHQVHREESPIHHGAMIIHVEGDPVEKLRGEYWTDRLTRGQVLFMAKSEAIYFDFDAATKGTFVDLTATQS